MTNSFASSEELKEGVHYYLYPDGRDVKHKIAILDHPMWSPRNYGTITLKSFRVIQNSINKDRPDIETRTTFRCIKDKHTGIIFGEPIGINNADKAIRFKKIPLSMVNTFELENPTHRRNWAMLSRDERVEGSPNQNGKPLYQVIDSEKKNINYLENRTKRKRCEEIIEGLSYEQQIELCPAIGINAVAYSQATLFAEIDRYIQNNYDKFLAFWDAPNRHCVTILKRALLTGVVQQELIDNGHRMSYMYGNVPIGGTESEAVAWLGSSERMSTLQSIVFQIKERENSVHKTNVKVVPTVSKDSDEVTALKAELAALRNDKKEAMVDVVEPEVNSSYITIGNIPKDVIEPIDEKAELAALHKEAKEVGVKGYALIKKPETLRKKIAEIKEFSV